MNFDFSQDQKLLQKSAQTLLKEQSSLAQVRKVMEAGEPYDRALWKHIAEAGWLGSTIPEQYGGNGFGSLELVLLAEELGASLACVPFSSSVYFAIEALLLAGSEEQKKKYLPDLASGKTIGCFAMAEGLGSPSPGALKATVTEGKLTGAKTPVVDGEIAHLAVVVAQGAKGSALFLVGLEGPGVKRKRLESMDLTRPQAAVAFDAAPAELLGSEKDGPALIAELLNRAAVPLAFEQLGGAVRCQKMALEYAKSRYAFGRPIGSFQAIKHKIVDMLVISDLARSNCYYAAWALENKTDLPIAAATARIAATEAFEFCSRENIQTHGGIGFTWEADPHLFFKRSKLLALWLGSPPLWRERLLAALEQKYVA
ncbi:MAG: acyl-CoA dehydrogenase family protein [Bdellovibrionota bacterium]